QVHFLVAQSIGNAVEHVANVNAALAVIGEVGAVSVEFNWPVPGIADDGIVRAIFNRSSYRTVVDTWLFNVNTQLGFSIQGLAFPFGFLGGLGLQVSDIKDWEATTGRTRVLRSEDSRV